MKAAPAWRARPLSWPLMAVVLLAGFAAGEFYRYRGFRFLVQDDQTQHIVWFRRYLPEKALAPDAIGDFFIGSNTRLYDAFYRGVAMLGIDPVTMAWVVAFAVILLSAWGASRLMRALGAEGSAPAAAAILTVLMLGFHDESATGAAHAMGWPLMFWGAWAIAAGRILPFALLTVLAAELYPPVAALLLMVAGIAMLLEFRDSRDFPRAARWSLALALLAVFMVFFLDAGSAGGPTISGKIGRTLPEFWQGARAEFFSNNLFVYWVSGLRSGIFPLVDRLQWPILALGVTGIPLALKSRRLARFAFVLLGAGLIVFASAHAVLFVLYLPSRYFELALTVAAILSGAAFVGFCADSSGGGRAATVGFLLALPVFLYFSAKYPQWGIEFPDLPELMARIRDSKSPGMIAGTSYDLKYVPAFTNRAVYWAQEFALPYKDDYRRFINERLRRTVEAIAAPDPAPALKLAAENQIAFLLIERRPFAPEHGKPIWLVTLPPNIAWDRSWVLNLKSCRSETAKDFLVDMECVRALPSTGG